MEGLVVSTHLLSIDSSSLNLSSLVFNDDNADLEVNVDTKVIKVHKSIVKECPYFAAIVDGNWVESQTSVVNLNGYSYKSVAFVLEHLYENKTLLSSDYDLVEIMALSDMMGIESLLNLICSTMITRICHNFHKPCVNCTTGVITSFQLAHTYNLTDVYSKCLEWLTRYFNKTWHSQSFASLPEKLQLLCLTSIKQSITTNNIIDVTFDCQQLQERLPLIKWALPVHSLVKQLFADCLAYLQENFNDVLHSSKFTLLSNTGDVWDIGIVEEILIEAVKNLPVEQSCLSYLTLDNILTHLADLGPEQRLETFYFDFITHLHKAVEARLCQRVGSATKCSAWKTLPIAKQKEIMKMGFFHPIDNTIENKSLGASVLRRNHSLSVGKGVAIPPARNQSGRQRVVEESRPTTFVRSQLRSTGPRIRTSSGIQSSRSPVTPHSLPASNASNLRSQSAAVTNAARPIPSPHRHLNTTSTATRRS